MSGVVLLVHFLEENLNIKKYANFLRDELQILLEVPLSHIRMWLQQNGCPTI